MAVPIHNTFAPLATMRQVRLALRLQFQPWLYKQGKERGMLRRELEAHFNGQCGLFMNGRQALLASLQAAGVGPGDEVIIQAYTCTVVPNAIIALGAAPVYCDISTDTLNIDPEVVRKKMCSRTKAIICQHTFGIGSDLTALRTICDSYNIPLIEDCAHVIPTADEEAAIGNTGDIIILSFGRDKAISGVTGGAAITSNAAYAASIQRAEELGRMASIWQIGTLLAYPLRYHTAKILWRVGLGLPYLKCLQLCKMLPPIYTKKERGGITKKIVYKLPNGCAILALDQWRCLATFNAHRRKISAMYEEALTTNAITKVGGTRQATALQKFPILVHNRDRVLAALRTYSIHLQDGWCGSAINPPSIIPKHVFYCDKSAPIAEYVGAHILNLPTHPTTSPKQAKQLVQVLKQVLSEEPYATAD